MTEKVISFFDCCTASREGQLSVAPAVVEKKIITVKKTAQTTYVYMEKVARRLTRWITVTAESLRRAVERKVRAFIQRAVTLTGVQILRQSAILRF